LIDTEVLRKKVIDLAVQGKLTEQLSSDGDAEVLYNQIQEEKFKLIDEGRIKKRKKSPEITDEEKYFEIPKNWKWTRLIDVCDEILVPQRDKPKYFEGDIPWCRIEDIDGKYLSGTKSNQYVSQEIVDSMNLRVNPVGTVISACSASIGVAAICKVRCITNQTFIGLVCSEGLYNEYLYYYMLASAKVLKTMGSGTTISYISRDKYQKMLVPLPPLLEQKRIVERIDEIFAQIDIIDELQKKYSNDLEILKSKIIDAGVRGKLTEQLPEDGTAEELYKQIQEEKARLIKEGKIKKCKKSPKITEEEIPFDIPNNWTWVRLEDVTANINISMADGPFGSNLKKEHYTQNKEVRIIQLSNIGENGWKNENVRYTTYKHLKTIERSAVNAGEIVIAKMMPAGRAIIVPDIEEKYVLSSDCVKFVPHEKMLIQYINYAINSEMFRKQVYATITGVGRERTSLSKLRMFLIPIPPYKEQKRIVEKINKILEYLN